MLLQPFRHPLGEDHDGLQTHTSQQTFVGPEKEDRKTIVDGQIHIDLMKGRKHSRTHMRIEMGDINP